MADVQKLSDEELSEAVDRIPLDLVADDPPVVKEWVERARAHRQLEKIGIRVTREEAIRISRHILKDAERGRAEAVEQEARKGPTYWDDVPTTPAGIRALSEVLKAWQQRQERMGGDERDRDELSWPNVMDARLDQIKGGSLEDKYAHVADMAAACLAWLGALAADNGEATPQSEDE